jgi:DNA polymerase elongation subunit (family B)
MATCREVAESATSQHQKNSSYGALLNEYFRFGDPRLGASTTYSGRQITTFMANNITASLCDLDDDPPKMVKTVNTITKKKRTGEIETKIENEYKMDLKGGPGVIYGDTDSSYFTMKGLVANEQEAIDLSDAVTAETNSQFPEFMRKAFNCQPGFDDLIKANRELVCRTGILQAKKKYMMAMVDKEGERFKSGDEGELKTMGSDIKLSSTPGMIKKMLKEVVMLILNKADKDAIDKVILEFRTSLNQGSAEAVNPLDLCSIVSVNKLDEYVFKWEHVEKMGRGKVTLPANVRSTINHNWMLERLELKDAVPIKAGQKIKILWLMQNDYGFTSIAFSSETEQLPKWFNERFEVDTAAMEQKLVDQKLQNIFDALGWSVPTFQNELVKTLLSFDD